MKRVKSACIYQTLTFLQREELGLSASEALECNRQEVQAYKAGLEKTKTRYQILEQTEQADGSIIVKVRKQYNATVSIGEYFN